MRPSPFGTRRGREGGEKEKMIKEGGAFRSETRVHNFLRPDKYLNS